MPSFVRQELIPSLPAALSLADEQLNMECGAMTSRQLLSISRGFSLNCELFNLVRFADTARHVHERWILKELLPAWPPCNPFHTLRLIAQVYDDDPRKDFWM